MGSNDLGIQLEIMVNQTLPEVYTHWKNGNAPSGEVELCMEAILACWDELASRQDGV
jgi:hypothetical protein